MTGVGETLESDDTLWAGRHDVFLVCDRRDRIIIAADHQRRALELAEFGQKLKRLMSALKNAAVSLEFMIVRGIRCGFIGV